MDERTQRKSLLESEIVFFSDCTYNDCTASDRLKVKLNSRAPAEHCTSITTQVESEFKNGHFSTTSVGFKVFFFCLALFET